MDTPRSLADAYMEARDAEDHFRHLYMGRLDDLAAWEDLTDEGVSRRQNELRSFADRALALTSDSSNFSDTDHAMVDTVVASAEAAVSGLTWRNELTLVNPVVGLPVTVLAFISRYDLTTTDHGDGYHEKLTGVPKLLADLGASIEQAEAEGRVATSAHLRSSAEIWRSIAADPASSPLAAQPAPTALDDSGAQAWVEERNRILADEIVPAASRFADQLTSLAERGRPDTEPGLCHLPGGDEVYQAAIRAQTTLDVTPSRVHEVGLAQVERLAHEYVELAGPMFGLSSASEIFDKLRNDPELRYTRGEDLVRDAEQAIARATEIAPEWFLEIPAAGCTAEEISQGPLAFYSKPNPDTGKEGVFFFNTADPSTWGTYQLEAVTFHESIPGHHLQLALVVEDPSIHPVNTELTLSANAEGWGLYTERLADEMGLYSSDLQRIGMLAADSMRACRLVIDTGLHAMGWSRQQAIDYGVANGPLSTELVAAEVDRFIGLPGQAVSYMMGRIEIDQIRAEAETDPDFDIRTFHHDLLRLGSVPLPTLRRLILGPMAASDGRSR